MNDIESIIPLKSNTKCGELYFENSIIKCVCLFCEETFETIAIFTNHLLEEHLYFNRITTKSKTIPQTEDTNHHQDQYDIIKSEFQEIKESEIPKYTPIPSTTTTKILTNQQPIYNCKLCKLSFLRRNSWRMHHNKYHRKTIIKPFVPNICHICNKSLCSKDALRRHHVSSHTIPPRPYQCSYCPLSCTLKGNLTQHEKIHTGEKRQKCNYCDKTFHLKFEKNVHERRVHTKERPYQCEICGQKFFTSTLMNNHKKRHTNTRNYGCNVCDKKFYDSQLLKDHMIAHSNEKPHKCDICMAKFGRRKALLQHIKIHDDIKQYNCLLCDKSFAQKPGLYSHMKSHAKQEKL